MKNKKLQVGYTLIELLTVMIILVTVGTIIISILVSSLRSGNKSATTNDIRQNGSNAIAQVSKMITYAYSFDGVNDGNAWYTDCLSSTLGAVNKFYSVRISSFDEDQNGNHLQTTFNCSDMVLSSQSASMTTPLVNPDTSATCWFTCSQNSLVTPPTIGIDLTLQKKATGTLLPESQAVIHFQTSVTMRNNNLQ